MPKNSLFLLFLLLLVILICILLSKGVPPLYGKLVLLAVYLPNPLICFLMGIKNRISPVITENCHSFGPDHLVLTGKQSICITEHPSSFFFLCKEKVIPVYHPNIDETTQKLISESHFNLSHPATGNSEYF